MSSVDSWILLGPILPIRGDDDESLPECITDLNRRLLEGMPFGEMFVRVDHHVLGKRFQSDVFLLTTKNRDSLEVFEIIRATNFGSDRDSVQVLLLLDQSARFSWLSLDRPYSDLAVLKGLFP